MPHGRAYDMSDSVLIDHRTSAGASGIRGLAWYRGQNVYNARDQIVGSFDQLHTEASINF